SGSHKLVQLLTTT
nr:Chain C, steroid receptor coactivator-1 [synthetic construct]1U3R_D Chain D, steroid receptor coactivator-1 [synthetic construct]1U3S_C Chain C, steroid receptor coactivator-1 [synthetic construct]1U3S_D Chain D, steroid receptor coactivator-1 [synthetic construct]1X76_C Chain C, Steroid Receptor Coactivator-1 [synthetic construct]1X76_D Chain D, Steroid Receptor Coactivator-1 [synthetic construct]1X78_C Chain C, Steroid Receptor Coactivator-1 [synthetic construct]1X78_D Chain D, Steroid 